jgi:eukaryotic-like serine/threonine-protein kinase
MQEKVMQASGRYFVLSQIGSGRFSRIYRAWLPGKDGLVRALALKRLTRPTPELQRSLRAEAGVLMRLGHQNIAQGYDFSAEAGDAFLVMELVEGRSLDALVRLLASREAKLEPRHALWIAQQAAAALRHVHQAVDQVTGQPLRLVHRAVCPQNLLVGNDGVVKLIDFGMSKGPQSEGETSANVVKGAFAYLAPEQVSGKEVDWRTDVYALGLVLWELLAGRPLFDPKRLLAELSERGRSAAPIEPPSRHRDVPEEVDALVLKALSHSPEARFARPEELHDELARLVRKLSPSDPGSELRAHMERAVGQDLAREQEELAELTSEAARILFPERYRPGGSAAPRRELTVQGASSDSAILVGRQAFQVGTGKEAKFELEDGLLRPDRGYLVLNDARSMVGYGPSAASGPMPAIEITDDPSWRGSAAAAEPQQPEPAILEMETPPAPKAAASRKPQSTGPQPKKAAPARDAAIEAAESTVLLDQVGVGTVVVPLLAFCFFQLVPPKPATPVQGEARELVQALDRATLERLLDVGSRKR